MLRAKTESYGFKVRTDDPVAVASRYRDAEGMNFYGTDARIGHQIVSLVFSPLRSLRVMADHLQVDADPVLRLPLVTPEDVLTLTGSDPALQDKTRRTALDYAVTGADLARIDHVTSVPFPQNVLRDLGSLVLPDVKDGYYNSDAIEFLARVGVGQDYDETLPIRLNVQLARERLGLG